MRITYRGYRLVAESGPERGWWAWPLEQGRPEAYDAEGRYPTAEAVERAIDSTYEAPQGRGRGS